MKPRFVLPPHPKSSMKIQRKDLPLYEAMGTYVAQRKFNGVHTVVWVWEDQVVIWDRRGIPQTFYKLTESMTECLLALNRDKSKEMILAGEVLHSKAKSEITGQQEADNTLVLFDVIMYNGEFLTKINQVERLSLLSEICGNPTRLEEPKFFGATSRALVVKELKESHLWLAEVFQDEFQYHFDECCTDQFTKQGNDKYKEIEGLVLRLKNSSLSIKNDGVGDVDWMIRCRKPKPKMYQF